MTELELDDGPIDEAEPDADDEMADIEGDSGVDAMFAADVAEAFPDLDDAQIAALQRAVLGLIAGGGSMGGPPPTGGLPF